MNLHQFAAATLVTATLGLASLGAQAVVVDISATSGVSSSLTLAAGTYNLSWIDNTANGGYDGWTYQYNNPNVREAFDATVDGHTFSFDVDTGSTRFNAFGSVAQALTAVNAGPYVDYRGATDGTVVGHQSAPFAFTLNAPTTISFSVPDAQLFDNTGGVSLAITAAVPEPETYALMLAGLGAMGFVARRRKAR